MRRLRHQILDLDTTIAYDEAEQIDDTGVQTVPKAGGSTESLGLDKLFEEVGDSGAGQTQGAEMEDDAPGVSQDILADGESAGVKKGISQDILADGESAEVKNGESQDPLADGESAEDYGTCQESIQGEISPETSTGDEQSPVEASSVLGDEQSSDTELSQIASPVRMTRRG